MVIFCWIASFLVWIAAVVKFAVMLVNEDKNKQRFTPLALLTVGTFLSALLLSLPVHCTSWGNMVQGLFLSVVDAVDFFSLDVDFETFSEVAGANFPACSGLATLYVAVLMLFAPLITVTNVISFFGDAMDNLQFRASGKRTLYILSALNDNSLAMAESIAKSGDEKRLIVFTNYTDNDEKSSRELYARARKLGAICLKKDITELKISGKKANIEFFLISDDEVQNLDHAVKLTGKHKNAADLKKQGDTSPQTIAIYVYSSAPAAQSIVDSLDKGSYLLNSEFLKEVTNSTESQWDMEELRNRERVQGSFSIQCVDPIRECVINVLRDEGGADMFTEDKVVSIAVVGMGSFGSQFLKNAVWFYQLEGCRVELNVFDKDPNAAKRLEQECPELISKSANYVDGEAWYDVHCYAGVDCFTSDFDDILLNDPRLRKTRLVFVAVGDDQANIMTAMQVRTRFNQIHGIYKEGERIIPKIYAVIRDDQLEDNLESGELKNHSGDSSAIKFVGTFSQQYSYDVCIKLKKLDQLGFRNHLRWLEVSKVKEKYEKMTMQYANFSYYRRSSISRALHEEMLNELRKSHPNLDYNRENTEHMRWNAYMRSIGYQYSPQRNDSAKLHNDLLPRNELPEAEQRKDETPAGIK